MNDILDNYLYKSIFPWWEWDIKNNAVTFNDKKATMLGYDPKDFRGAKYQNFTNLLHKDDYHRTMQSMKIVLDGRKELYQIDYRILASDGTYKWYMDRGTVIEKEYGNPIRMRGIVINLGSEDNPREASDILLDFIKTESKVYLNNKEQHIYTLCSNCSRVKAENDRWVPVSDIIISKLEGAGSHGICPSCIQKLYPEYAEKVLEAIPI
ncbi:PAS domain S-box protein [Thiospirochaeta perfilievii]|uniref:histidine kinase n=1 Tax=Thiospirochaeta perfilievii TaxID=252967 RepID=A0A5C1QCD0_9SPIO|nr:PAS domain-containing protein [Thiospirochaeta perfilievii]QEN05201.1 PAS domain S-box protein [Thiospirochaeta perfilievii]